TVSVEGSGVRDDGMTRAVSQVQQMRASACYQRSEGRMSCNSCHPAHSLPDPETKADYYRGRCLECHAERGCSVPEAERATPPAENSCVYCHMPRLSAHDIPHASQTDHRVGRSRTVQPPEDPNGALASEWELFDHAEQRLAPWEVDRVRGLNHVQMALLNRLIAPVKFREAEPLLRSSLRAAPDDVRVLEALGRVLLEQERAGEARECLERLLEIRPRQEKALDMLAEIRYRAGEFAKGIEYGERLLAVNPWIARYYARQSDMLRRAGRLDQAIECGEKALRLDPWQSQVRGWLVEAYGDAGDESTSRRHAELLRRMRGG
ncbi:MAG TPA: tetratricopeptide repeat protein, partial [Pirellulales bacterium]|nr:tetratricopeptide repeat protein [Pirellulales bacterium]